MDVIIIVLSVIMGMLITYQAFNMGVASGKEKILLEYQVEVQEIKEEFREREQKIREDIDTIGCKYHDLQKEYMKYKEEQEDISQYLTSDGKYFRNDIPIED